MTDEEKKERFETVKRTHDELKEHPYWINFDEALLKDVLGLFGKISRNYWGTADTTNPYYAIIRCVTHDFNCMLGSISGSIHDHNFERVWKPYMGDVIMVLQVYLMNIHRMIENREPDGSVVGYTFTRSGGLEIPERRRGIQGSLHRRYRGKIQKGQGLPRKICGQEQVARRNTGMGGKEPAGTQRG